MHIFDVRLQNIFRFNIFALMPRTPSFVAFETRIGNLAWSAQLFTVPTCVGGLPRKDEIQRDRVSHVAAGRRNAGPHNLRCWQDADL